MPLMGQLHWSIILEWAGTETLLINSLPSAEGFRRENSSTSSDPSSRRRHRCLAAEAPRGRRTFGASQSQRAVRRQTPNLLSERGATGLFETDDASAIESCRRAS